MGGEVGSRKRPGSLLLQPSHRLLGHPRRMVTGAESPLVSEALFRATESQGRGRHFGAGSNSDCRARQDGRSSHPLPPVRFPSNEPTNRECSSSPAEHLRIPWGALPISTLIRCSHTERGVVAPKVEPPYRSTAGFSLSEFEFPGTHRTSSGSDVSRRTIGHGGASQ